MLQNTPSVMTNDHRADEDGDVTVMAAQGQGPRAWTSRSVDDVEPKLSMRSRISCRSGQTNQWNFSKLFRLVVYAILISEGLSCRSEGAASDGQQSAAAATLPSYVVLTRPPQPQITRSSLRSECALTEPRCC
jgi:hypothetical protein